MKKKILGILLIIFGGLVLYSNQEGKMIVSAVCVGVGSGLYFFPSKNKKD